MSRSRALLAEVTAQHRRRNPGRAWRPSTASEWPTRPEQEPGEPQLQPKAERGGERAVEDRDPARRAAEQDRLGQRAVQRRLEAVEMVAGLLIEISAPPPKLKKDRKKEEAAKAIERPKTIWISRRKPPAVSPKARVRPVMMMMITATILATGPWTDSRTFCSGCLPRHARARPRCGRARRSERRPRTAMAAGVQRSNAWTAHGHSPASMGLASSGRSA